MLRPDRVRALVALSVAFTPRSPARRPVDGLKALFGDEYYICRIQVPTMPPENCCFCILAMLRFYCSSFCPI
jgi:hypothetical protein